MPVLKSQKQEKFAQAIAKGCSGRQAYRETGLEGTDGSADVQASRWLKNPKVAARVKELQEAIAAKVIEKAAVTPVMVIEELSKLGFSNMGDFIRVGPDGDPYTDFSTMTREQSAAIGEITVEDFKDGRGDDARDVRRVKFKLLDKRAALVDIGKHLGMFKERVEHSGTLSLESLVLEATKRRTVPKG